MSEEKRFVGETVKPARLHAKFAVNMAGSLASLLSATSEAKK
jgi:hypothetical protein